MISSTKTITTTATLLVASTLTATRTIWVEAVGNDIHIGGSNVTTSNGLTVKNGDKLTVVLPPLNSLYAIVNSGSHTAIVMEPSGDF